MITADLFVAVCAQYEQELWLPICGYETAYDISDLGRHRTVPHRVRTCSRRGTVSTRLVPARIRVPTQGRDGDRLRIRLFREGTHADFDLATVVLTTFDGPAPTPDHYAEHRDGDRSNNRLENLYWSVRDEALAAACSHMKVL
ncbi:NUMOD4 domain-containing protein [Mycobacterium paraintracellulare]|uniref:NUMOD4 domain-containing protein n=1 Tax=Mycobacterium paraintracellulare TaxID=1138383 RepID=UPI0019285929|nr:HNH endonuclease [Mycobacterium paraintracellulare]BCP14852.1 hypothetical protein MINTM021_17610 [Mycobacterium paraintracellulare]